MNDNPNPKSSASQCKQILAWLQEGKTLTSIQALTQFGVQHGNRRSTEPANKNNSNRYENI